MSDAREKERNRRAWELAGCQHGVVARRQLLALGFTAGQIEHRVARGRLHLALRGVYTVGWPRLTPERRWMAAVLACGEDAMLSHRSAAALWGIGTERRGLVDVTVRRRDKPRRTGLLVRARPMLSLRDVTLRNGIPVTGIVQTLIDLATELDSFATERAINEADKHDLIDPEDLRLALNGYAGRPGAPALRRILDKRTFRLSDSHLEVLFRPIAAAAGLPPPLTQRMVNGYRVDFFWPDLGLVVETDGLRYHRTPLTQTRDARRDRAHAIAGMTALRFTHYEIKYERALVRAEVSRITARLLARTRH